MNRPISEMTFDVPIRSKGSKHKTKEANYHCETSPDTEKKLEVDEETKRLSALFATHFRLAEAVKQPRRVQLVS